MTIKTLSNVHSVNPHPKLHTDLFNKSVPSLNPQYALIAWRPSTGY
jgi:hypothetical protein